MCGALNSEQHSWQVHVALHDECQSTDCQISPRLLAKAAATARLVGDQTRAKPLCVTDTSLVELGGKFLLQAAW